MTLKAKLPTLLHRPRMFSSAQSVLKVAAAQTSVSASRASAWRASFAVSSPLRIAPFSTASSRTASVIATDNSGMHHAWPLELDMSHPVLQHKVRPHILYTLPLNPKLSNMKSYDDGGHCSQHDPCMQTVRRINSLAFWKLCS